MRSLGRWGVPVYNLDPDPWAPAFSSRYCCGRFVWDIDGARVEDSLEYLFAAARRIAAPCILIPTTDRTALFVAEHANVLRGWFRFQDNSPQLVRALCSKQEMYWLARAAGVPTAEAAFPKSRIDVVNFLGRARFPIMLKGIDGARLWERTGKKMFIVRNQKELLERYDQVEDPAHPNLMLQEYIPGGDDTVWMFNGYFDERSDCLLGFTGKKIRQCPVYTGCTSLGICLQNDAVDGTTRKFMKAIGYRGILDIGYRFDARDGQYKVLDVNPRIGATFRLFVADNGMDVARAMYLHTQGAAVPAAKPREGRKWIVEDLDTVSCFRYWRDGNLTFRQWLASFRGLEEAAFLAADDLRPLLPLLVNRFRELLRRTIRGARNRRGRARSHHRVRYA